MNSTGRFLSLFTLAAAAAFLSPSNPAFAQSAPPSPQATPPAAPTAAKPAAASSAIRLPLFFEANEGQSDPRVRFLTRGNGYTLFLTPTETVLSEPKAQLDPAQDKLNPHLAVHQTPGATVRMQLLGANSEPAMTGLEELPGKVNYLIGNDSSQWHTGVPLFSKVRTEQVYPGVDLLFHGDQNQLEYDFVVAPGADPSKIKFRIRGAAHMEIDSRGDLVLHTPDSDFRMHKPLVYQTIASERRPIEGSFVKKGKHEVAFQIGPYDHSQSLVIDPSIVYATFLGGNGIEEAFGIAVDDTTPTSPKLYVGGYTSDSTTFPESSFVPSVVTTIGSPTSTTTPVVTLDGFVAKIDPTTTGSASLIYLTFVGGKTPAISTKASCFSGFIWLALDESQGASAVQPVLGGQTTCSDFPHTKVLNPVTATTGNGDSAVATRLTVDGSAVDQSVLLGGDNDVEGGFIAVDSRGNVILSGDTLADNLPPMNAYVSTFNNGLTPEPYDDCFVSRLNRSDLSINYLTYLNVGAGSTTSNGGAGCGAFEEASGNILAGGNTYSTTAFNLGAGGASLANGFQTTFQGTEDTFAMELNPNLGGTSQLLYATYYGGDGTTKAGNGSFDLGNGVVAIVGDTTSGTSSNPTGIPLMNAYQSSNLAAGSANGQTGYLFVIDTENTGQSSLLCSTYFGGSSGNDTVHGVSYDAADPTSFRILLGGETFSTDFPTLNELQPFEGTADGFVSVLKVPQPGQTPFNASLYFSTFIGDGAVTTAGGQRVDNERIEGLAVDSNHTIYAVGTALSSSFFANTNLPTPNGFQTTCTSCDLTPALDDLVVFSIGTGSGATLTSIAVSPTSPSIVEGATQQFAATGYYNDGTAQNITTSVTWGSTATNIATISNASGSQGLATASTTNTGTTQITAALSGITSPAVTLTVTTPTTLGIDISNGGTGGGTVVSSGVTPAINCFTNGQGQQTGACSEMYAPGTVVNLTETPNPGVNFLGWSGPCNTGTGGTSPNCTVTIPSGPLGAVSAQYGNGSGSFTLTTALPANTSASTGGGTIGVTNTGGGINCTFNGTSTPTGTCSVSTEPSGEIIGLTATPNVNSTFGGWAGTCPYQPAGSNDCFVTMGQNETVTPVFSIFTITLTVSVTGNGSITSNIGGINCANPPLATGNICSATYNSPSTVILTATPGTGYSLSSPAWTNACSSGGGNTSTCTLSLSESTNPTGAVSANASFTINTYLLNVSTEGGNGTGTVTSNPNNLKGTIDCGPNNQPVPPGACGLVEQYNWSVTLTEVPTPPTTGTTNTFTGWTASGVSGFTLPASCTTGAPSSCTFNMPVVPAGALLVTATFTEQFELMVTDAGPGSGKVTSQTGLTPAINCVSGSTAGCTAFYSAGQAVTLTAAATGTGSTFAGWSGAACLGVTAPTCSLTMTQPLDVTATFTTTSTGAALAITKTGPSTVSVGAGINYTITVTNNGPAAATGVNVNDPVPDGLVPSTIQGGNCAPIFNGTYTLVCPIGTLANGANSVITYIITPKATGTITNTATVTGTNNTNTTSNSSSVTTTVGTTTQTFPLTVTNAGTGTGTVTSQAGLSPAINCTTGSTTGCSANYNAGTSVTLTATPASGSNFAGWSGACTNATGTCTVTMSQVQNVTATFNTSTQTFAFMVNEAGSGSGTVTSQSGLSPAIDCTVEGGTECSATYNSGTVITLTATPGEGSTFMGWVGGTPPCSGTSTCTVTMTQEQSVTAIFNTSGPVIIADWDPTSGIDGDNDKQRIDGKTPPLLVTLTNTSTTQTVNVTGVTSENPAYTITTTCTTLGPGQTCTVSASFTATSLCQSQNTTITVADDDPGGNFQFTIEGFGADSGLQVADLTSSTVTAQSLAQSLVGPGVTISNVTYRGARRAAGTFSSSSNIIGFNSGIVLSTGSVRNVVGPNCSTAISVDNGEPGDPDLSVLAATNTNDAAVLEFDFVPTSSSISFQYVFASDEYPEFVGQFNDAFGFFLGPTGGSAQNIALIPGTELPVTINNVNGGSNPQFFINNNFQLPTAAPVDTEMDGLTVALTAQAQVIPGNTYHIKLAIADASDFQVDSNVFIKAGSLVSSAVTLTPASIAFGNQQVGVTSGAQQVTLSNTGTTPVAITSIVPSAGFGESDSCPTTLAAAGQDGSSCTLNITFTPAGPGPVNGTVTVTDNSPVAGSTQIVTLSGTGTGTAPAVLSITKTHTGNFTQGQQGAQYTVTVSNGSNAGPTSGTVTVADTIPSGLTLASMSGTGWSCEGSTCTRSDALAGGASYPAITVTVNVSATATSPQVNMVSVSGGGSATASASDSTVITPVSALSITKVHTGNFAIGQQGATYTVTVSNGTSAGPTSGAVTVTEIVPEGLVLSSMSGTGWSCGENTCTRSDALAAGASYPSITVAVNVTATSPTTVVNTVNVSGGGSATASASDTTNIVAVPFTLTIVPPAGGSPTTPMPVSPGGQIAIGLLLTPIPGFSGTVTFSCASSAPQFITCAPAPSQVKLSPTGTQVAVVVNTFCSGEVPGSEPGKGPWPGGVGVGVQMLLGALALGGMVWSYRRRSRWALSFAVLVLMALGSAACNSLPKGPAGATPPGNYQLTITATANGQSAQVQANILVVQ